MTIRQRVLRAVRAVVWPTLAFVGVALLAAGVAGRWKFHRDLYIAEETALFDLVQRTGPVEYRRAGEPMNRVAKPLVAAPPTPPWSVGFVGRVEYVDIGDPGKAAWSGSAVHPYAAERDAVLRLPGLRGFAVAIDERVVAPLQASLDRLPVSRLPSLPPPMLKVEQVAQPLPRGEPLEAAERQIVAQRIAEAWTAERSSRPRLVRVEWEGAPNGWGSSGPRESLYLSGDDRAFDFVEDVSLLGPRTQAAANVVFRSDGELHAYQWTSAGWRCVLRCDADLPEARKVVRPEQAPVEADPYALSARLPAATATEFLGEEGGGIAIVERIDDERLYVETKPRRDASGRSKRLSVVVRVDMDHAIEAYKVDDYAESPPPTEDQSTVVVEMVDGFSQKRNEWEIRRLDRVAGETIVLEALWGFGTGGTFYFHQSERTRIATELDPNYPEAFFDPAAYGDDSPRPAALPVVRAYRAAWAGGAGLMLIAAVGSLVGRLRRRPAPGETSRFRLRFGLATLLIVAMLVISAAGWAKRHLDEAEDQRAALAELAGGNARAALHRSEPRFPWSLVSTDAMPLDRKLDLVLVEGSAPAGSVDRLTALSPDVRYAAIVPPANEKPTFEIAERALGIKTPEFDESEWFLDPSVHGIPRGEPVTQAERDEAIAAMLAAWRSARADYPQRYLLREEIWHDGVIAFSSDDTSELITVRDEERFWTIDLAKSGVNVECRDGSFRRRFVLGEQGWELALREPLDVATPDAWAKRFSAELTEAGRSGSFYNRPSLLDPAAPFVERRIALPPFCDRPGRSAVEPDLNEALLRLTPSDVGTVERLDEDRLRLGLLWPFPEGADAEQAPVHSWTIVVRTDLDWAVERCDYVSPPQYAKQVLVDQANAETSPTPWRANVLDVQTRVANRLARRGGHVVLTGQTFESKLHRPNTLTLEFVERGEAFYAVMFDPRLTGPIFDRATVDSPGPPLPDAEPPIRWYGATALFAVAALGTLGVRRTFAAWRKRRAAAAGAGP